MSTTELVPIAPARFLLPSGHADYIAAAAGMTVAELLSEVPEPLRHMCAVFLNGTEVDYQKTLMGQGFVFKNPNAKGACGCGTSFNV